MSPLSNGSRFNRGIYNSPVHAQVAALTAAKLAHSCGQQVLRGVDVSVVDGPAFRASPLSDIKPQFVQPALTLRAGFAGRKETIQDNQSTAIPSAFVLQLSADLSPASVGNMPSQPGVLNHVFNLQVFNTDNLIFTNEFRGQLVSRVLALLSDFGVCLGNPGFLTLAAFAAFGSSGKRSLLLFEIPRPIGQLAWILNLFAVAQGRKVRQAEINANGSAHHGQKINIHFDAERYKVFAIRVTPECDHLGAFNWQLFGGINCSDFRQAETTSQPITFAGALESEAFSLAPLFKFRIPRLLSGFNSPEEIRESLILIAQTLSNAGCRNVGQPRKSTKLLEPYKSLINIKAADALFPPLISLISRFKRMVPNPSCSTEPMAKPANLCASWISPDFVGFNDYRHSVIISDRRTQ